MKAKLLFFNYWDWHCWDLSHDFGLQWLVSTRIMTLFPEGTRELPQDMYNRDVHKSTLYINMHSSGKLSLA